MTSLSESQFVLGNCIARIVGGSFVAMSKQEVLEYGQEEAKTYAQLILQKQKQQIAIDKKDKNRMDNIEIKKAPTKRTMQSLLEQSAIDNSYNHQAQELRQAYTKTIKDLHARIKEQEKSISKLQLEIKQKDQIILEQYEEIGKKEGRIGSVAADCEQMTKINAAMKKRLQHLEYKIQTIENNRKQVLQLQLASEQQNTKLFQRQLQQSRKHLYSEVRQILQSKITRFLRQVKQHPMNPQLQQTIEAFLEDLLYINPSEGKFKNGLFEEEKAAIRGRRIGKISGRGDKDRQKLTELEEWKKMEKSVEKLKNISPLNKQNTIKTQDLSRVRADHSPRYKPLINYI